MPISVEVIVPRLLFFLFFLLPFPLAALPRFKNFDEKARYFEIRMVKNPGSARATLDYARVFFERKNYSDTALWLCQKVLAEIDRDCLEAAYLAGIIYYHKELFYWNQLKKHEDKNLPPKRFRHLLNQVNLTWRLGHPDEKFIEYLIQSEKSTKEKIRLVRLYLIQQSQEWFQYCLRIDPGFENARRYLELQNARQTSLGANSGAILKNESPFPKKRM